MDENLYLVHHGVKGMRWGIRNYQNYDGRLTSKGRVRYQGINYTTSERPKIHRVKVKGAGRKYGKYRNASKEHQSNAQAPSYQYVTSDGTTYSYSGANTGNYHTDTVGEMLYAKERKEKEKENRRIREINKARYFIRNLPESVKNTAVSAISRLTKVVSNGLSFISNLLKR